MVGEGSGNNYAYLVSDDKSKEAVIIDPASASECVLNTTNYDISYLYDPPIESYQFSNNRQLVEALD